MGYVARKVLGCEEAQKKVREEVGRKEVQKHETHFDDEVCDLHKPQRVRSSFVGGVGV